jgi:hypothetical protein
VGISKCGKWIIAAVTVTPATLPRAPSFPKNAPGCRQQKCPGWRHGANWLTKSVY